MIWLSLGALYCPWHLKKVKFFLSFSLQQCSMVPGVTQQHSPIQGPRCTFMDLKNFKLSQLEELQGFMQLQ